MEKPHPNHPGRIGSSPALAEELRTARELRIRDRALEVLDRAQIPYLVGGAYAFSQYTGIYRDTKDLDLFLDQSAAERAIEALSQDGWRTERHDRTWIYKGYRGSYFVDLIFSSGNGVADVDADWFRHAEAGRAFGRHVWLVPAEELVWSKAFVLERERYDGADVSHLLRAQGHRFEWPRLMRRFDRYWEVLLSHLMLFRFTYPSERAVIPSWVMAELLGRAEQSTQSTQSTRVCRGNLLSRVNYAIDIAEWGYADGRRWDERQRQRGERDGREQTGSIRDAGRGGG